MKLNFYFFLFYISQEILQAISQSCGKLSYGSGLIVNGEESKRGEFPFLVALIRISDQKFFCAGNLITKTHILTGEIKVLFINIFE